jgi:hypothetical protein
MKLPPNAFHRATELLRQVGPYAAIELLLPGGSLIALFLWLTRDYRREVGSVLICILTLLASAFSPYHIHRRLESQEASGRRVSVRVVGIHQG